MYKNNYICSTCCIYTIGMEWFNSLIKMGAPISFELTAKEIATIHLFRSFVLLNFSKYSIVKDCQKQSFKKWEVIKFPLLCNEGYMCVGKRGFNTWYAWRKNMSPEKKKTCYRFYISLKTTLKTINRGKHLRVAHCIKISSFRDITLKSSKQLLPNQLF